MHRLRFTSALLVLGAALLVSARRIGPAPALGSFLEPAHGVWSLARSATMPSDAEVKLAGLGAGVRVVYDDRAVPHIFATTEADAYRALGYVVARDRLFQLYVQTMAASGRLTELAGARALPLDREMRGLGLPRAAERKAAALSDTSRDMKFAGAYADGINAYIASMPASELPLEFRLTGKRPETWTVKDSYHLINRMAYTLAYIAVENDRSAAASRVGTDAAMSLFPDNTPIQEPIQPNGQRAARFDFTPLVPPGAPDSSANLLAQATNAFMPSLTRDRLRRDAEPPAFASNNWAVSPSRSATGHALLAGDPHLDLSLPSIWYEVHMVVPGVLDVYGVTIPGAPAVVIGFNRDVAWTFTNNGADVVDYYAETVDDTTHPARYRLNGEWRKLDVRVERYMGAGGAAVAADTLYFTHRGPMRRTGNGWTSMRWTALEDGNEFTAFHNVAHARSAAEVEDAMARWYRAPVQNMLAADRGGHIAIRSNGAFPVRPGDGSGAHLRDGRTSASDWTGMRTVSEFPQAFDPAQGFIASANQQPIDPKVTKGWWGGSYDPWRAMRINTLLRADSSVTVDAMRSFQTDPGSARADYFAPHFLAAAQRVAARGSNLVNVQRLSEGARMLGAWDRRYVRDTRGAALFEASMSTLVERTWDELVPPGSTRRAATPSAAVLAQLLADSASAWWDDRSTPQVERRDDILAASLVEGLQRTESRYGKSPSERWLWSRIRHAQINHLLRIPALSALELPVQGGPSTLSPSAGTGTHGASWRMVVELGPQIHAWSTYPGGQSGNPISDRYRDRISTWMSGKLEAVRIPATPNALGATNRSAELRLVPVTR